MPSIRPTGNGLAVYARLYFIYINNAIVDEYVINKGLRNLVFFDFFFCF